MLFTEYLDLALLEGPTADVIYPSIEPIVVGDKVAVIGYNGRFT